MAGATSAPAPVDIVTLSTWGEVKEAFRRKELRQSLYDEGAVVMADCLLTLHGDEHRDRRRLENRLFRREVFHRWENELLGTTVELTLAPFVAAGRADLLVIAYRSAMNLTAAIAGVDHDPTSAEATERLYAVVKKFSEGATLVHSTRDHDEVRAEVAAAMDEFDRDLLGPSIARRRALLERVEAGRLDAEALPRDVLTTLLRDEERLGLAPEVVRREISFYLQAGAHSTANAFTHAVDELFTWARERPDDLARARGDRLFVQRCVHETLRLHPASPVAWRTPLDDVVLASGTRLPRGSRVVMDLEAANRDPAVWGPAADRFDPHRVPPEGVPPWGHSFGGGPHACIGMELDGGTEPDPDRPVDPVSHLYGTVAVMVSAFLAAGGHPDPDRPAELDPHSVRRHFSTFPVVFGGAGA